MYHVYTIAGTKLHPDHIDAWRKLLSVLPGLDSPYFQPQFTELVSQVRADVHVAFIEVRDTIIGIFPFQRGRFGRGKPVGGRLSDFHGIISDTSHSLCLYQLLLKCGLTSYHYDHLMFNHFPSGRVDSLAAGSPFISMPNGFLDYSQTQRHYSKHFSQYQRKLNKIERDHGPIRLVLDSQSESDFQQLLQWKQEQYQRTGAFNPLRFAWTLELLRKIWDQKSRTFQGLFSTLHVGAHLVGAHFGMRSRSTLHYWFPAYNPVFQNYSPGNLLLLEVARAGSADGIMKVDLGKGCEEYKLSFGSAQTLVAEGCAYQPSLLSHMDNTCQKAKDWLKSSTINLPVTATARALRPFREWLAFR